MTVDAAYFARNIRGTSVLGDRQRPRLIPIFYVGQAMISLLGDTGTRGEDKRLDMVSLTLLQEVAGSIQIDR